MTFIPDLEERMQQQLTSAAEQDRQSEPYEVKSARSAHEAAQERLARVNEPGPGFRNYSQDEREATARDAAEKETAFRKVSNEHTRARYLEQLEEKKAVKAKEDAARIEMASQIEQTRVEPGYKARFIQAGGTEAQWAENWPQVWNRHLMQKTMSGESKEEKLLNEMRASIRPF